MDVAVFGASGFVGRNLLAEFAGTDHTIHACDVEPFEPPQSNATFREVDITEEDSVDAVLSEVDTVAHLAAHQLPESKDEPKRNAEVNVIGSLNVLESARRNDVEKVFFSSASSLVGEVETVPVQEDHPAHPQSPYGVAKHAVEEYLDVYRELYDLDYLVFRFFNVYGPHQYPASGALVPVVMSRLHNDQGVYVTGDGSQTRDFVYVRDVTSFIREGLEGDVTNEVVNMGRGVETEILEAIHTIADVVDTDPDIDRRPERPDEIDDFYADTSRCEALFGRAPDTGLQTGLEETYKWMRESVDLDG